MVVEQQRDHVTVPDAEVVQPGRERGHPPAELPVGHPTVAVDQNHPVGPAGGVVVQDVREVVHLSAPSTAGGWLRVPAGR